MLSIVIIALFEQQVLSDPTFPMYVTAETLPSLCRFEMILRISGSPGSEKSTIAYAPDVFRDLWHTAAGGDARLDRAVDPVSQLAGNIPSELHIVVRHEVQRVLINQREDVAAGLFDAVRREVAVKRHLGTDEIADAAVDARTVTLFDCRFHYERVLVPDGSDVFFYLLLQFPERHLIDRLALGQGAEVGVIKKARFDILFGALKRVQDAGDRLLGIEVALMQGHERRLDDPVMQCFFNSYCPHPQPSFARFLSKDVHARESNRVSRLFASHQLFSSSKNSHSSHIVSNSTAPVAMGGL